MQGVLYELLIELKFLVLFLSVLLIPTCGRLNLASSLLNVWAHYKIVIDYYFFTLGINVPEGGLKKLVKMKRLGMSKIP